MDRFYSKTDYLNFKLDFKPCEYNGECEKTNYEIFCGPCFWRNITVKPVTNIPECSKCLEDMSNFKDALKTKDLFFEFESKCCVWCIWFDWFDHKRKNLVSSAKKEFKYIWNYQRKKK